MKLIVLDGNALNPGDLSWSCIEQLGAVTVYDRTPSKEGTIRRIGAAQIVLLNRVPIESHQRILDTTVRSIRSYLRGTPKHVVNH